MNVDSRVARATVLVGAGILVLWHAATLTRSPVPYYDDTFFASVGDAFTRTGQLRLPVSPLHLPGPVYLYGPVYFFAQRLVFRCFGFGIFQNRVLGLVASAGVVLVAFAALRQSGVRRATALTACVLLALDPTLHLSAHGGRMDAMALFFLLASFVVLQKSWASRAAWAALALTAASGALAAFGALTTPRPGYLVVIMGVVVLGRWARERTWIRALQLACWGLAIAGLYGLWVWYAFGSLAALAAYYAQFVDTYVGGRFTVHAIHYPLLALLAGAFALRLLRRGRAGFDEIACFTLAGIVAFYALGIDPPRFGTAYCVFFTPLVYMALARLAADLEDDREPASRELRLLRAGLGALLLYNLSAFVTRSTLELAQWQSRDPAPVAEAARRFIPPGSKVIGDDKFYFAIENAGSDFQYWQRGGTLDERVAYHVNEYGFEYLVAAPGETSDLLHAYAARVPLVEVATLAAGRPGMVAEWLGGLARRLGIEAPLVAGYEGSIYARADRGPVRP